MTLIVSWLGIDSRGPASLYMMSDSRISWQMGNEIDVWDYGKKVFAFSTSPDIIGYCGDTFFTTQVISHVVSLAGSGLLFSNSYTSDRKFDRIKHKVKELLTDFPHVYMNDSFTIMFGTRVSKSQFVCYELTWRKSTGWAESKRSYNDFSDKLMVFGSGANEFLDKYERYQNSEIKRTSRAIYQCFCDTLDNIKDRKCGGAPQLVGLYRIKNGIDFGIVYKGKRYVAGVPVENLGEFNNLEWRNELFERFGGSNKQLIQDAQRQPNPIKKIT